jgi:CBS domain-containing protein
MDPADRTSRVHHPILRLRVVSADGTREGSESVFCRFRRESVPVERCASCSRCDDIREGKAPSVDCTIPTVSELADTDARGERIEVGTLLRAGTTAVDTTTSLQLALRVLREEQRTSMGVVDDEERLVGIVHELGPMPQPGEWALLGSRTDRGNPAVASAMSAAVRVHEAMPVRVAVYLLAAHHLREAVVVTPSGKLLGLFRDVDALRWLARARSGPADDALVSR